jgi:hypothetical protein
MVGVLGDAKVDMKAARRIRSSGLNDMTMGTEN